MIIYMDLIMIYDFLINAIIMYSIEKCYKQKVKKISIIIPSVISSLFIPLFFINYIFLKIFSVCGGLIMYLFMSKRNTIKEKIIKATTYYLLNFAFIGILKVFDIQKWFLLLFAILVLVLIFFIQNNKKYYIFNESCKYNVIVKNDKKIIELNGFLDTGNKAMYKGIPICFVNEKYKKSFGEFKKQILVNIDTISGSAILEGYIPSYFLIEIKGIKRAKKVILCFVNLEEECLVNSLILCEEV
ncbi:MAG: sigma-E processing peptidase SpoIIGA [Bacilli bacterium]|nr:sigma-E processing peptidase SpoIIGA [Bacilli bacterium]